MFSNSHHAWSANDLEVDGAVYRFVRANAGGLRDAGAALDRDYSSERCRERDEKLRVEAGIFIALAIAFLWLRPARVLHETESA